MLALGKVKITTKFILWFLFISLVPLATAIFISYGSSQNFLKDESRSRLVAVCENKANQVEGFLQRKAKEASQLAADADVIGAFDRLNNVYHASGRDSPEYSALAQEFNPMFSYYQKNMGYNDIILVSLDGEIVFSALGIREEKSLYEAALYKKSELASVFLKCKKSQEIEQSNFEYSPGAKEAFAFIGVPVVKGTENIGVIAFQIGSSGFYEFVNDNSGLGETGEIIIVSESGGEAVFVTPVRFDPEATFRRKVKIGSTEGVDIQNSLKGGKGAAVSVDYRGKRVLSTWRSLPAFNLGLVVKMDISEVFSSARLLRNSLLRVSLILAILAIILALFAAHTVSVPIKELTYVSKIISSGDLTMRAQEKADDEIGDLSRSFNQMTDKLVEAKAIVERQKEEVEEQRQLLEKANKELDSFVYTVSHDLKGPLRGIDGFTRFLEEDYADKFDEQGKEYLGRIRAGTERMKRLIEDLLTLSRISRIKNPFEQVPIAELIKSILGRQEFDIKQYKAEVKIAEDMPVVYCDRIKIEEALLNLVSNAIKYSSKNKEAPPRVEIGYSNRSDEHEFYVKDNGIGIDPKYHQEIFGIFRRLHRQDEYEGTGAGLSIVKRIIDDHRGRIWLDSQPGKGSTFYFTLPKAGKDEILGEKYG